MRYFFFGIIFVMLGIAPLSGAKKPGASIYDAIQAGDHEELERILKKTKPEKLNKPRGNEFLYRLLDIENLTPLQYACDVGDLQAVRMLVEAGADVNMPYRSYIWGNPLWYANNRVNNRDRFLISKYLVDAGADCTNSENALRALTDMMSLDAEEKEDEAICQEQLDVFRTVYEMNEAVTDVPMVDAYPGLLAKAAGTCGLPVVKFLIKEGYPVNPEPDKKTGHTTGDTPLGYAAYSADVQAVEYLLSQGADVSLRDMNDQTPLEAVSEQKKKVETEEWLKHLRKRLDDYDRVIEILKQAGS
ncbi:MAG: ankyrin repeat domain-containing protein [Lachnospiraceae bacterium]|nr:ankyrin repeat domain-containing protein [Lachnospiraceae bacterium]